MQRTAKASIKKRPPQQTIYIRVSPPDVAGLRRLADLEGLSMSDIARRAIRELLLKQSAA